MKPNLSDHQFLEGGDTIIVQSYSDNTDYAKSDTKHVKVESLREDVRNYVEKTTSKDLKVFRSTKTTAGGSIEVLDNETLYYYPSTPTSGLNDSDITITSSGDFFTDNNIKTQKEFNEHIYGYANSIEVNLDNTNKYLDAIIASTEFDDDSDPTEVKHFTNDNAYPPTVASTAKAEVVNVNDLSHVHNESVAKDQDLQNQLDLQETRITALFNVRIDSGYFISQSTTPTTDDPAPGQIKVDLTNTSDTIDFSIHTRAYEVDYNLPENEDEATRLNNYISINPNDKIVTMNNTYKVLSVTLKDENANLDEKVFNITAEVEQVISIPADGDFTTLRVISDGQFDPSSLVGEYVRTVGDRMTGKLEISPDNAADNAFEVSDTDGNVKLNIRADGSAITTKTVDEFGDNELITKNYVDKFAIPVGGIVPYVGALAPDGWLMCDGGAIPTQYVDLIAMVGTNTPNLNGRFLGGAGGNGLELNNSYNYETAKPKNSKFSQTVDTRHRHTVDISETDISTGTAGGHSHSYNAWTSNVRGGGSGDSNPNTYKSGQQTSWAGVHSHTFSLDISEYTDYQGSTSKSVSSTNWDSRTRPDTYAVNYIIKHD